MASTIGSRVRARAACAASFGPPVVTRFRQAAAILRSNRTVAVTQFIRQTLLPVNSHRLIRTRYHRPLTSGSGQPTSPGWCQRSSRRTCSR